MASNQYILSIPIVYAAVNNLIITPVYNNTIPEVKDYMNKENRYSEYDDIINLKKLLEFCNVDIHFVLNV